MLHSLAHKTIWLEQHSVELLFPSDTSWCQVYKLTSTAPIHAKPLTSEKCIGILYLWKVNKFLLFELCSLIKTQLKQNPAVKSKASAFSSAPRDQPWGRSAVLCGHNIQLTDLQRFWVCLFLKARLENGEQRLWYPTVSPTTLTAKLTGV